MRKQLGRVFKSSEDTFRKIAAKPLQLIFFSDKNSQTLEYVLKTRNGHSILTDANNIETAVQSIAIIYNTLLALTNIAVIRVLEDTIYE